MLRTSTLAIIAITCVNSIVAQNCGSSIEEASYTRCLSDNQNFHTSTCKGLSPKFTLDCQCYYEFNKANCYDLCIKDPGVRELKKSQATAITAACKAADLTFPLPCPAPWVTNIGATTCPGKGDGAGIVGGGIGGGGKKEVSTVTTTTTAMTTPPPVGTTIDAKSASGAKALAGIVLIIASFFLL